MSMRPNKRYFKGLRIPEIYGFTLPEVLITLVIFTLIMMGLQNVALLSRISFSTDMVLIDLGQQARQVMFWVTKDIREATDINIIYVDQNSDTVTFNTVNDPGIQYYKSGNQIIREDDLGNTRVIGNYIQRFKVVKTNHMVDVDIIASRSVVFGQSIFFPLREQVNLRND